MGFGFLSLQYHLSVRILLYWMVGFHAHTSFRSGAASFTIYTRTKEFVRDRRILDETKLLGAAGAGGLGGALAGSLISFSSARECQFFIPVFIHSCTLSSLRAREGATATRIHYRCPEGDRYFQTAGYPRRRERNHKGPWLGGALQRLPAAFQ